MKRDDVALGMASRRSKRPSGCGEGDSIVGSVDSHQKLISVVLENFKGVLAISGHRTVKISNNIAVSTEDENKVGGFAGQRIGRLVRVGRISRGCVDHKFKVSGNGKSVD